jgi:hypothetical protein
MPLGKLNSISPYKSSSEFILSGFKTARYEDMDMKFMLITSYTMAVSMAIRASNEGLELTALGSAFASTINACNILTGQLDDDVETKFISELNQDVVLLEKQYTNLYIQEVEDSVRAKQLLNIFRITKKIAGMLRILGVEIERNVVATIE